MPAKTTLLAGAEQAEVEARSQFAQVVAERDTFLAEHPDYMEHDGRSRIGRRRSHIFSAYDIAATNLDRCRIRAALLRGEKA